MPNYKIIITEKYDNIYPIEAIDEDEAVRLAYDKWDSGKKWSVHAEISTTYVGRWDDK